MRPLANSQRKILLLLLERGPMSQGELGRRVYPGRPLAHGNHGQGNVRRAMSPAVFVTPACTALRKRGLTINTHYDRHGMTYYEEDLTQEGEKAARQLKEEEQNA